MPARPLPPTWPERNDQWCLDPGFPKGLGRDRTMAGMVLPVLGGHGLGPSCARIGPPDGHDRPGGHPLRPPGGGPSFTHDHLLWRPEQPAPPPGPLALTGRPASLSGMPHAPETLFPGELAHAGANIDRHPRCTQRMPVQAAMISSDPRRIRLQRRSGQPGRHPCRAPGSVTSIVMTRLTQARPGAWSPKNISSNRQGSVEPCWGYLPAVPSPALRKVPRSLGPSSTRNMAARISAPPATWRGLSTSFTPGTRPVAARSAVNTASRQ